MKKKVALFLVDGFEEIEAIAPIDLLRRAGIEVNTISITESTLILSARNIKLFAEKKINDINFDDYDMIVLPGGPGTKNYYNSPKLLEKIKEFSLNKKIGAICAAPTVLAKLGLLENKEAVCFPACKNELIEGKAILFDGKVKTTGNITTSKSAGTAIDFALELIEALLGKEKAEEIKEEIFY